MEMLQKSTSLFLIFFVSSKMEYYYSYHVSFLHTLLVVHTSKEKKKRKGKTKEKKDINKYTPSGAQIMAGIVCNNVISRKCANFAQKIYTSVL